MSEDVDYTSYQHRTPDCKGRWIDVSSLSQSAAQCSECRVTRTPQDPGFPHVQPVGHKQKPRLPTWLVVLMIIGMAIVVGIGIFGG